MRRVLFLLIIPSTTIATIPWDTRDFKEFERTERKGIFIPPSRFPGEWQRWSYIHELIQTASFISSMQVTDTTSEEFGGIIEGENALNIVETDNTLEAIWVWSRYYEITDDTVYFENIRRAWYYVENHPPWLEEGTESDYYRVWNCALLLFAESKYREVFGDTTYRPMADTCVQYIYEHPLPFDLINPFYARLHPKVTAFAAGNLYRYGIETGDSVMVDTALVYGERVRIWIEEDPETRLNDEVWAMSGGTLVWGLCNSLFLSDSTYGVTWLNTYLPLMEYFEPSGDWSNSWNIWYANAYNHAGRITGDPIWREYHHSLTDSLLVQDLDDDGGIPPGRWGPSDGDHSWVSSYMVFMGFEGLMDSIFNFDAGVNAFIFPNESTVITIGDTVFVSLRVINYGFEPLQNVELFIIGDLQADTIFSLEIGEADTISFPNPIILQDTGTLYLQAFTVYPGDGRSSNDTLLLEIDIRPAIEVTGTVIDTLNSRGVSSWIYFSFINSPVVYDSTHSDSSGYFVIHLPETLYSVYLDAPPPYPPQLKDSVYIGPDSNFVEFTVSPATLLLLNHDDSGSFSSFYESSLESLDITYYLWSFVDRGVFPISKMSEFLTPTIIWFTGNSKTNTVLEEEEDSLINFLNSGGYLLITGQNIGEDIGNSVFYTDYLHAHFIDDSVPGTFCYPILSDPIGSQMTLFRTSGFGGAGNQVSRDRIEDDGQSSLFLTYDSLNTLGAALYYGEPGGYKVAYFAFGLEGVSRIPSHPEYMTREEILAVILNWFGIVKVEELQNKNIPKILLYPPYPNPTGGEITLKILVGRRGFVNIALYDVSGRFLKTIYRGKLDEGLHLLNLGKHLRNLAIPSGTYFIYVECEGERRVKKITYFR
jgi:hypothetical protein